MATTKAKRATLLTGCLTVSSDRSSLDVLSLSIIQWATANNLSCLSLVAWDLLAEITWSKEMGFMKTGTDIKNMIHIGELSMMYLGLVKSHPFECCVANWLTPSTDWTSPMVCEAVEYEPISSQSSGRLRPCHLLQHCSLEGADSASQLVHLRLCKLDGCRKGRPCEEGLHQQLLGGQATVSPTCQR